MRNHIIGGLYMGAATVTLSEITELLRVLVQTFFEDIKK